MTEPTGPDYVPSPWGMVAEQVAKYEATGGREGGDLEGVPVVILTTRGRKTGKLRKSPLMRVTDGRRYAAIASVGGAPKHPSWYLNLLADPEVTLQDGDTIRRYRSRVVDGDEEAAWLARAVETWPDYAVYPTRTDRHIPVVVLEPMEPDMDTYQLADRLALVTGASSGIGQATARALAAGGARVVLVARREERLKALAAEIEATGIAAHVFAADLSVREAATTLAAQIEASVGEVDILVNNAGGVVGGAVWAVADHDEGRDNFEVDLWSPLALIGAFVPGMRRRGHGAVVNVTTIRQILAWPAFGHSAAAKAALSQITETLRLELLRFGVRVVEVIPGPIDTAALGLSELIPGAAEAIVEPLGIADPAEIADMVVEAIRNGDDRVFCPEATTRAVYEDPVAARARIKADVQRLLPHGSGLPDELLDTLVVGANNPLITEKKDEWEHERAATES